MSIASTSVTDTALYELRFQSLFHTGRACSFPCDVNGEVCRDAMSERALLRLAEVEASVGIDFATPAVQLRTFH